MVRILILVAFVAVASASTLIPRPPQKDCVHWCKVPKTGEVYCCNDGTGLQYPVQVHLGDCPEVRDFCPRDGITSGPALCAHDGYCSNESSKCCYDICLKHHTCKPAINVPIRGPPNKQRRT